MQATHQGEHLCLADTHTITEGTLGNVDITMVIRLSSSCFAERRVDVWISKGT